MFSLKGPLYALCTQMLHAANRKLHRCLQHGIDNCCTTLGVCLTRCDVVVVLVVSRLVRACELSCRGSKRIIMSTLFFEGGVSDITLRLGR